MPQAVKDAKLQTRNARSRLTPRREPYWRSISPGAYIGYRRGKIGGTWVARFYRSGAGYRFKSLGVADDVQDADGAKILNFAKAQEDAREWFKDLARMEAGLPTKDGYTVKDALADYFRVYSANGKSAKDVGYRIEAFILPKFGKTQVAKLTTTRIRNWLDDLANTPARVRAPLGQAPRHKITPMDDEAIRKRRHSANKVLTILKAALNHAYREGIVSSDDVWRRVKPFTNVDQPRIRFAKNDKEIVTLVRSCDAEFRPIVQAALLTGARYSELTGLSVGDFDKADGTLYIRPGKTGKSRYAVLSDEGTKFFVGITGQRSEQDVMFPRKDGTAWGKSHQGRRMLAACKNAHLTPPVSFHILRHWYAANLVRAGIPISVIAEILGHSDPKITMRHYGHLSRKQKSEIIRSLAPSTGIVSVAP